MAGLVHRGLALWWPCMPCWDSIMAGLACGELVLWVDLAHSDRVAVVVDLHVAKMEAAIGLCGVKQRQWQGIVRLEG